MTNRNTPHKWWSNSIAIIDVEGAAVCILTRGYEDGPSMKNAQIIVDAVNNYKSPEQN